MTRVLLRLAAVAAPVLLCAFLSRISRGRSAASARRLLALFPEKARVRRDGAEYVIPSGGVAAGEIVLVGLNERIPVDGEILDGSAIVDEQALTGAEDPVRKIAGDTVFAGTLNIGGPVEIFARKTSSATVLKQIADLLRSSGKSRDTALRRARELLGRAAVLFTVGAFAVLWLASQDVLFALERAFIVFVASFPFSLAAAARSALDAAARKATAAGVLPKSRDALIKAARIDTLLLGRTGALADGAPEVTDVAALPGFFEEELLTFSAAALGGSKHPFAAALLAYTQPRVVAGEVREDIVRHSDGEYVSLRVSRHGFIGSQAPPAERFVEAEGQGVCAVVGGRAVIVGTPALLKANGVDAGPLRRMCGTFEDEGKMVSLVAINGRAAGVIAARLNIKPYASETAGKLTEAGVSCYLLTGGSARAAKAFSATAGILGVLADVPRGKRAGGIARTKAQGREVAVAGNGARDVEALGAADVGFAMGGSPARSDIYLITGDLRLIPAVIELARRVVRSLKRSIVVSGIFAVTGGALAAAGRLDVRAAGVIAVCQVAAVMLSSGRTRVLFPADVNND